MDTALNTPRLANGYTENDFRQKDAPFPQIYELIFHNQSLVRAELEVLQHLIQKKLEQYTT